MEGDNDCKTGKDDDILYIKARNFLVGKGYRGVERLSMSSGVYGVVSGRRGMLGRLWEPSKFLEGCVGGIERSWKEEGKGVVGRQALDIGCGSGRDAAFLASRGWSVVGLDRDVTLLENAKALGQRYARKGGKVQVMNITMGSDVGKDRKVLNQCQADLLLVIRFLRRSILPLLPNAVKPGGYVVYEHFCEGCEKFSGPKNPSFILQRTELAQLFIKSSFTIIKDEVSALADGRPVIQFIAKRDNS